MTAPTPPDVTPINANPNAPLSPIQRAAREALSRVAQGELELPGSLATPANPPSVVTEGQPTVSDTVDAEAVPDAEAVEATEDTETTEETSPGEGEGEPKKFTIAIPNNREGLPDIELEVDDEHTYNLLGQLKNGFKRGEEARAMEEAVLAKEEQLESFRGQLEADPIGFIADHVPDEARMLVIASMISDQKVFPHVVQMVRGFIENPAQLEIARARIETERMRSRETLKTQAEERRAARQNAGEIMSALNSMVPGTLTGERAQRFLDEARAEVSEYATRHNLRTLPVTDLPVVLAQKLLAYGIDPVQTAARLAGKAVEDSPKNGQPSVGARIKQASERRKAAAVSAPAGVQAPATEARRPPKGLSIKEAADWAKKNLL